EVKPLSYNNFLSLLKLLSSKFNINEVIFNYKNLIYDFKTKVLSIDGTVIELTKNEILFIELLIVNKDEIITYEMIQRDIYREKIMSDSSIKNLILRLRKKLTIDFITTITGIGYKLS
ncbi:MAG: winged helix-turn-helix domain-containing protein, partial [Campylobacterota bacterium]|nr:winged helix-turn-helix domain-containing protein [Campylobacterota bacterium]